MTPTVWLPFMATLQLAVVALVGITAVGTQFAEKPNTKPVVAVAVIVTEDCETKSAVHEAPFPQLIPAGLLVIVPAPCPTGYMLRDGRFEPPLSGQTPKLDVSEILVPSANVADAVIFVRQGGLGLEQLTAVAKPEALMVATSTSADCHTTELVMSCVAAPPLNVPIAMN